MAKKMTSENTKTKAGAQVKAAGGARKMRQPEAVKTKKKSHFHLLKKTKSTAKQAGKQGKKSHKKTWIIGGVIVLLLVGIGTACAIFIPLLFQPKYGESYAVVVDIKAMLDDIYSEKKAPCQELMDSVFDENVSLDRFDKMIDGCEEDLIEVRDLIGQLGATSGIVKDETLQKKYDKFAKTAESTMPADEEMKQQFKTYVALHEFSVWAGDIEADSLNEETLKSITQVLIDSGDKDVKELGEGFRQRTLKMLEYIDKMKAAAEASDYSEYYRLYSEMSDYSDKAGDWMSDQKDVIMNKDWMLDEDSVERTKNGFNDLYKAVREMYEKYYDGKNEVECTKKGDGVVKCK